jgi:hypothetical protein
LRKFSSFFDSSANMDLMVLMVAQVGMAQLAVMAE